MSITLDLPRELEDELSAEAAQLRLSLPEYVLRVLSTSLVIKSKPETGAVLVDCWRGEGIIGTRPDISDSQTHARQVRAQAERR